KGFEGLADLVRHHFGEEPVSGHLFVFANRHKTRLKILYWDGTGTWVCAKKLPKGTFCWPATSQEEMGPLRIVAQELTLLLGGIDLDKTQTQKWPPKLGPVAKLDFSRS